MSSSSSRRSRRPSSSSTHSTLHANRQPKWRSPQSAPQPATSISKVFAQPLQASPLRSAIDTVAGIDDATSIRSEGGSTCKQERSLSSESDTRDATSGEDAGSAKTSDVVVSKEVAPQESAPAEDLEPLSRPPTGAESSPSPPPADSSSQHSATANPTSSEFASIPFPALLSDSTAPLSKSPSKPSSWFGSLSRSRGVTPVAGSTLEKDATPLKTQPTDPEPRDTSVSQPQPISESSTSPMSPSDSLDSPTTTRPTSPRTDSGATSGISSVDDEVPPPKFQSEGGVVGPEHTITHKLSLSTLTPSASSVTSLNPSSSSRFMLRIPLLGRPKMPLDQAVAQASADVKGPSSEDTTGQGSTPAPESPVPQVVVSVPSAPDLAAEADADVLNHVASPTKQEERAEVTTSPELPTEEEKPEEPKPSQPAPSTSSWFSYLWSESTTVINESDSGSKLNTDPPKSEETLAEAPAPEATQPASAEAAPSDDHARRRTTSDTPAAASVAQPSASPAKRHSSELSRAEIKEINADDAGDKKPTPSLFSAETSKSQGSAWYSPWSWYAASPIVPSTSTLANKAQDSDDTLNAKDEDSGQAKTESEMVKEEALARAQAQETVDETKPSEATPEKVSEGDQPVSQAESTSPLGNPIESSMSTHREGWMSFFMSKAMMMKTITSGEETKRDENGMEVMDIEDDDEPEDGVAQFDTKTESPQEPKNVSESASRQVSPPQAITIVAGKKHSKSSPTSPSTASSVNSAKSPPPPPSQKEREPKKSGPPAPPLTDTEQVKKDALKGRGTRSPSPAPSKASTTTPRNAPPNLVLPTWQDTFLAPPRSNVPPPPSPPATQRGAIGKTLHLLSDVLLGGSRENDTQGSVRSRRSKGKEREDPNPYMFHGMELPKALDVLGQPLDAAALNETCRVVVIGVAGWSPGAVTRTLAGGLPSSSSKFVNMTCTALERFEETHGFKFQKITKIPLEGDGTIERKVAKVHAHLFSNEEWVNDLHAADVIFIATHSQGSVVSTHLLARLLSEGHILTQKNMDIITQAAATLAPGGTSPSQPARAKPQRICCLALCGIHLGPLRYLRTSSLLQPYIQYFENAAARELFDFQNTESEVSRSYVKALNTVMDHGAKMVYIASLNDQVVPIYSGIFASASHPRILRALYIDGDAYSSSDFLSNLLVLLIRIRNSGLSDSGLLTHLSEATAGTLSGVGHSTAYEELATYSLAVDYLFLTTDGGDATTTLTVEPFNAVDEQNDYEIPWSLRDLIADERVAHFFAKEFAQLRDAFDEWAPKTTILRDVKRKLQPIQKLSSIKGSAFGSRL